MLKIDYKIPLYKLESESIENNIFIKREDTIPFSFGGNKVRIGYEFIKDMKKRKCDCLISYGGLRSNLNRVLVNFCKKEDIECFIVSSLETAKIEDKIFNKELIYLNIPKKNIFFCKKDKVSETLDKLLKKLKEEGKNPYYINGNIEGKGNEKVAVKAYEKCYQEILKFEKQNNIYFDYIFLASGTGMTQAGLEIGKIKNKDLKKKIIGISISRKEKEGKDSIYTYVSSRFKIQKNKIIFIDKYLLNGYGVIDKEINKEIIRIYQKEGVPLDYIYTGKAYHGMKLYLRENKIKNKNILFIHTGGIPLFFDYLNNNKQED